MTTLNNGLQYPASSNGNLLFGWKLGSWAASVLSAALRFSKQCSSSPGHGMQRPLRSHQHSIQMSSHHTAPGQGGTHRTPAFNGWGGGILVQHQGKTTRGQRPIMSVGGRRLDQRFSTSQSQTCLFNMHSRSLESPWWLQAESRPVTGTCLPVHLELQLPLETKHCCHIYSLHLLLRSES